MKSKFVLTLAYAICIGCCGSTDCHADDSAVPDAESHREGSINRVGTVGVVGDEPFRLILLIGFLAVFPVAMYHRIRSQASGEKLDRLQEGWFILATLRPVAIASIAATLTFVIRPSSIAWSQLPLPAAFRWSGVPLGIVTAALLVWVFRTIGTNLTDTVVTRKEHQLVTHGPYRWVRHPLYSATLLAAAANGLVTANWFVAVTGGTAFLLLMIRSKREEEFLMARFDDEYREYRNWTGAVVPYMGQ